jgi:molecular chaperone GrpE
MPEQQDTRRQGASHPSAGSNGEPAGEVAALKAKVPELEEKVADLEDKVADLDDRWRRALADLDNLRKRLAREAERDRSLERARVAAAWLPILDNLELALSHAGADPAAVLEGVRAVRDQAIAVLAGLGFARHDERGERFDPNRHEAVSTVAHPDAAPGTVVHVVRPGYGEGDTLLRPAAVVVSTKDE